MIVWWLRGHGFTSRTVPNQGPARLLCLVLALAVLATSPLPPTFAAGFVVNSTGDAGDGAPGNGVCATSAGVCTLRAAIEENNATGGGNVIAIPAMTITIQSVLMVSKAVTITGAGQRSTIIDGGGPDPNVKSVRGFYFAPLSGSHALSGLTIQNMRVTHVTDPITEPLRSGNGAAILNEASLALSNVDISNNQADQGGGIYSMYDFIGGSGNLIVPSLVLNTVMINGNSATAASLGQGGGGLFNGAALDASNVTITNNTSRQGGGFYNNNPHNRGVAYSVALNGFVVNGNAVTDSGGGIDNDLGTIILNNGVISGNTASISGGGIYNNFGQAGTPTHMTLSNVGISNNSVTNAGGVGGGILNIETMALSAVTINDNSANYGAGIQNGNSNGTPNSLSLMNVTVSGNRGITFGARQSRGGGIFNTFNGVTVANNATLTLNSAIAGGGLDNQLNALAGNSVTLRNTILAGNAADAGWSADCQGTFNSGNYNLIGSTAQCSFALASGDRTNVSPLLAPLRNNGGSTLTHAMLPNSPVTDTGNPSAPGSDVNACANTDQRGVIRPQGSRCDIGAFEFRPNVDNLGTLLYLPLILNSVRYQ